MGCAAAAQPSPSVNWSGVYLGIHGGYANAHSRWVDDGSILAAGTLESAYNTASWLGGVQGGLNFQSGAIVAGLDINASFGDLHGKQSRCYTLIIAAIQSCSTDAHWLTSVAARVGIAAWERWLLYGKLGFGWSRASYENPCACGIFLLAKGQANVSGPVFGAGVEYALAGPWSLKVEYSRYQFNEELVRFTDQLGGRFNAKIREPFDVATIGLNYRFPVW